MQIEWADLLRTGAASFGVELDSEAIGRFDAYTRLLLEWNQRMNLTSITEPGEIVAKHYVDSLALLGHARLPRDATVADVGSGAGFPGMPLAIARPDLRLVCFDSLRKRILFLQELTRQLGLTGVECRHIRAEEAGRLPAWRERFDAAVARAVGKMALLAEYCLPLVRPGGCFYAMKGPGGVQEAEEAAHAIGILGGHVAHTAGFLLPGTDSGRTIVQVKKERPTPARYPRPYAAIGKHPL